MSEIPIQRVQGEHPLVNKVCWTPFEPKGLVMITAVWNEGSARGFFINDHSGYARGTTAGYNSFDLTPIPDEMKLIPLTDQMRADAKYVRENYCQVTFIDAHTFQADQEFIQAAKRLAESVGGNHEK